MKEFAAALSALVVGLALLSMVVLGLVTVVLVVPLLGLLCFWAWRRHRNSSRDSAELAALMEAQYVTDAQACRLLADSFGDDADSVGRM